MKVPKKNTRFTIRPFQPTDLDYAALVKLVNQEWPNNPSTVEVWKQKDSKHNPNLNRRYIGELEHENGNQMVAVGFVNNRDLTKKPGNYFFKYYIGKNFKSQGLDELLYTHMITDLADKNPVELKTETRKDNVQQIKFFEQKGFQQSRKAKRYSELDVRRFDQIPFARYMEKVAASGIVIVSLEELENRDSNWIPKLHNLQETVMRETLGPDVFQSLSLEEYAKLFERVDFRADAHFVALHEDNFVGLSSLWSDSVDGDVFSVGTTSVLPSHRRRGIATALKLKTIAFAQAHNARSIQTRNVVKSPMYTLNMKLGFKPGLTLLFFDKIL